MHILAVGWGCYFGKPRNTQAQLAVANVNYTFGAYLLYPMATTDPCQFKVMLGVGSAACSLSHTGWDKS